ncbi:hypothetical protein I7635_03125 [Mycoplasma mycoides subsp. capri]|uniref:hypothetical protein n=1 Tax=Mycoplasma mycoides TaxID=2102 RepID=UPI00223FEDEE|nr:hypothetical protein [Mycoplasma mycoides]QVK00767.1 hypothetical protein I7635_03125 [Mycoplasma mycoides subsp. capri]
MKKLLTFLAISTFATTSVALPLLIFNNKTSLDKLTFNNLYSSESNYVQAPTFSVGKTWDPNSSHTPWIWTTKPRFIKYKEETRPKYIFDEGGVIYTDGDETETINKPVYSIFYKDSNIDGWNQETGSTETQNNYGKNIQSYYALTGEIELTELGFSSLDDLIQNIFEISLTFDIKRYYIEKDLYDSTYVRNVTPNAYNSVYLPPGGGNGFSFNAVDSYDLDIYSDLSKHHSTITKTFKLNEIKNQINEWIKLDHFERNESHLKGRGTWDEFVKFEFENNKLKIFTKSQLISETWSYKELIFVAGKTLIDKIEIQPNFKYWDNLIQEDKIYHLNKFTFNSETSDVISDEKSYKVGTGEKTKSNKELVLDKFKEELNSFKSRNYSSLTETFFNRAFPNFDEMLDDRYLESHLKFEKNKVILPINSTVKWPFTERPFNIPTQFELPVEINFNPTSFSSEINNKFNQLSSDINIIADYSTDITDQTIKNEVINKDEITGQTYGSNLYTNNTLVHKIIEDRIQKLFIEPIKNNFLEEDLNKLFEHTISFDTIKKRIKINFISNSKYKKDILDIENNKVKTIYINYNVSGSTEFNKKITLGNGLTLESGKYFDTKTNKFIRDIPEIKETQTNPNPELNTKPKTYIYHSDVTLEWKSDDPSDVLVVNGEIKEPSDNNTFRETFNIPLINKWNDETKKEWNIQITSKKPERKQKIDYQFVIRIEPVVKENLEIKNLGWKPDKEADKNSKEYNQWLITQEFLFDKDGNRQPNPKFVPNLNPKTGFISNFIFIRHNTTDPTKNWEYNNFPTDLVDKDDKYVFDGLNLDNTSEVKKRYEKLEKGFIAEVLVTRGGIDHLFADKKNNLIEKIEKIKVDPKTFNDINDNNSPVLVNSHNNNSIGGLWHYRITLKDYIKPEYDEKGIQTVPSPIDKIIKPTEYLLGTTIHKYVYIDHKYTDNVDTNFDPKLELYLKDFLSLKDFKQLQENGKNSQWKFKNFWQTSQAKHFIAFYSNLGMSTSEIKKLDYEQIVYLWKKYISSIIQSKSSDLVNVVKRDLRQIEDLNLKLVKNKTEAKKLIEDHILRNFNWLSETKITLDDLNIQIVNSFGQVKELNENNISDDFINFDKSNKNKKMSIQVSTSDFSTILKRNQFKVFTVTNSLYDLTSLNDFSFYDINTNFDKLTEQDIRKFITNTISSQINSKYNKSIIKNKKQDEDITLTLGKDYQFFLAKKEETDQLLEKRIKNNQTFASQKINDSFTKGKSSNYRIVIYALENSQYISSSNKKWFINDDKKFNAPSTIFEQLDIKELFKITDLGWINKKQYEDITDLDLMNKLIELNKNNIKKLGYDSLSSEEFLNELNLVKNKEERAGRNRFIRNYTFDIISKNNSKIFKGTLTGKFQSPNNTNIVDKARIDNIFKHNTIIRVKKIEQPESKEYFWNKIIEHFNDIISRLTFKPEKDEFDIEIQKKSNSYYEIIITAKNENKHFTGSTNIFFIEDSTIDEIIKPKLPDEDKSPEPGYNEFSPDDSDSSRDDDSTNRRYENKPGNNSSRNPDSRTPDSNSNRDDSSSNGSGSENGTSSNSTNPSNEDQPGDYVSPYKPGNGSRTDNGNSTEDSNNRNNGENPQGDENKPGNNSGDNSSRNPDSRTPGSNSNRDDSSSNGSGSENGSRSGNENGTSSNPANSSNEDQPGDYVSPYKPGNISPESGTNTDDKWWEKEDNTLEPTPKPKEPEDKIKPEDKWILGLTKKDRNWIIAAGVLTLGVSWVISYFWWKRRKLIKKNKVIKTTNKKKKDKKLK